MTQATSLSDAITKKGFNCVKSRACFWSETCCKQTTRERCIATASCASTTRASQSKSSRPCLVWAEQRRTSDGLLAEALVQPSVDAPKGAHGQTGVWSGRVGDRRKLALIVEAAVNGWWDWRGTHVRQTGVRFLGSYKLSPAGMSLHGRPYDFIWTGHDAWISDYGDQGILPPTDY